MLPSRGLRPALSRSTRSLKPVSARSKQFSTGPTLSSALPQWRSSRTVTSTPRSTAATSSHLGAIALPSIYAARCYSSGPPPQTPAPQTPHPVADSVLPPPKDTALPTFEEITSGGIPVDTTEQIGFLKGQLGLDFGWGPTAIMEWTLEHIHVYSGLPWWGSILTTALAMRIVLMPLYFESTENVGKMSQMKPITAPLQKKNAELLMKGEWQKAAAVSAEMRTIQRAAGLQVSAMTFAPMVMQGVLGYGMWRLLRNMGNLPVPGLLDGGILWFQNLSVADPYYILPLSSGLLFHLVARRGTDSGDMPIQGKMRNFMLYGLPALTASFIVFLPATVQWYMVCTAVFTQLQQIVLRNNTFRGWFNLTPILDYKASTAGASTATLSSSSAAASSYPQRKPFAYAPPRGRVIDTKITPQTSEPPAKPWELFKQIKQATQGRQLSEEEKYKKRAADYERRRQREIADEKRRY